MENCCQQSFRQVAGLLESDADTIHPDNGLTFMAPEKTNRLSSSKVGIPSHLLVDNDTILRSLLRSNVLQLASTQDTLESGKIFLVR